MDDEQRKHGLQMAVRDQARLGIGCRAGELDDGCSWPASIASRRAPPQSGSGPIRRSREWGRSRRATARTVAASATFDEAAVGLLPESAPPGLIDNGGSRRWRVDSRTEQPRSPSGEPNPEQSARRSTTPASSPKRPSRSRSSCARSASTDVWADALAREINERRRAECMARIQRDAVQLALDLLVREPDITGFFRVFIKTLVEECESHACGVWLLDDDVAAMCNLWMAYVEDRFYTKGSQDWDTLTLPSESMSAHLLAHRPGWSEIIEYDGADARLPEPVRAFNIANGIESVLVAPLLLPGRNLGWFALSSGRAPLCDRAWHHALLDAMSRQATLALHQSLLAEQSRAEIRRQAVLEERNRLARDIHDTLAQGFAAILMQLQGAQRSSAGLPPGGRPQHRHRGRSGADAHGRSAPLRRRAAAAASGSRGRRGGARADGRARAPRHRHSHRSVDRRAAGVLRRRRPRNPRHRPGSDHQRRAPRPRPPDRRPRRRRPHARLPPLGRRRRARHRQGAARRRLRHDQHAGARRSHRRLADDRHRAAVRHRSRAGVGAGVVRRSPSCTVEGVGGPS